MSTGGSPLVLERRDSQLQSRERRNLAIYSGDRRPDIYRRLFTPFTRDFESIGQVPSKLLAVIRTPAWRSGQRLWGNRPRMLGVALYSGLR